ncbi:hypothetical protein LCGC14_1122400 [marine sediment metagenome]|uniref:Uncharacterized protein n=1 Tax=marine sediment metagenome TaxID=412755 RepID=A0A0F9Q9D4_9ZZZZ
MMIIQSDSVPFINHNITIFIETDGKIEISDFPEDFIDLVLRLTENKPNGIL